MRAAIRTLEDGMEVTYIMLENFCNLALIS